MYLCVPALWHWIMLISASCILNCWPKHAYPKTSLPVYAHVKIATATKTEVLCSSHPSPSSIPILFPIPASTSCSLLPPPLPFLLADAEWKLLLITQVSSQGSLPHWGEIFCIEHVTVMSLIEDAQPEGSRLEVRLILPTLYVHPYLHPILP